MDDNTATLWWIAGGVLVAAELASGTFYLLMLALGCAAAALAAHAGGAVTGQVVVGALVGVGATAGWNFRRMRQPRSAPAESKRDVNLDIGQTVVVRAWGADGSTHVSYRGANWQAGYEGDGTPAPGPHAIVAVRGNRLMLSPASPH